MENIKAKQIATSIMKKKKPDWVKQYEKFVVQLRKYDIEELLKLKLDFKQEQLSDHYDSEIKTTLDLLGNYGFFKVEDIGFWFPEIETGLKNKIKKYKQENKKDPNLCNYVRMLPNGVEYFELARFNDAWLDVKLPELEIIYNSAVKKLKEKTK